MEPNSGMLIEPYSGGRNKFGSLVESSTFDELHQVSSSRI